MKMDFHVNLHQDVAEPSSARLKAAMSAKNVQKVSSQQRMDKHANYSRIQPRDTQVAMASSVFGNTTTIRVRCKSTLMEDLTVETLDL